MHGALACACACAKQIENIRRRLCKPPPSFIGKKATFGSECYYPYTPRGTQPKPTSGKMLFLSVHNDNVFLLPRDVVKLVAEEICRRHPDLEELEIDSSENMYGPSSFYHKYYGEYKQILPLNSEHALQRTRSPPTPKSRGALLPTMLTFTQLSTSLA